MIKAITCTMLILAVASSAIAQQPAAPQPPPTPKPANLTVDEARAIYGAIKASDERITALEGRQSKTDDRVGTLEKRVDGHEVRLKAAEDAVAAFRAASVAPPPPTPRPLPAPAAPRPAPSSPPVSSLRSLPVASASPGSLPCNELVAAMRQAHDALGRGLARVGSKP